MAPLAKKLKKNSIKAISNNMKYSFIFTIFFTSLLLNMKTQASDASWVSTVHNVKSENEQDSAAAIKALEEDQSLDQKVIEALKEERFVSEALRISSFLKRPSLFGPVLNYAQKNPTGHAITAAMSLRQFDESGKLPLFITELSTSRWSSLSSTSKLVTLFAISELDLSLSLGQMKRNLEDSSDQVRIVTTRVAGKQFFKKQEKKYAEVIKVALHSSPYQLRLEALNAVKKLPRTVHKNFYHEIHKCLSDPRIEVKNLCSEISIEMNK